MTDLQLRILGVFANHPEGPEGCGALDFEDFAILDADESKIGEAIQDLEHRGYLQISLCLGEPDSWGIDWPTGEDYIASEEFKTAFNALPPISLEDIQYAKDSALAKIAYAAYGKTTDNKNFRGEEMPKFDQLPDKIKEAWINASLAVADAVSEVP